MTELTRTLKVRIWNSKGRRLPKDTDQILAEALAHAAEMIGHGYSSGQIPEADCNGWWEVSTEDTSKAKGVA